MKKTVMKINYLANLITVMLYYYSWEDAFGGYTHYDAKGKKIGYSRDGFLGTTHYDERGREVGRSEVKALVELIEEIDEEMLQLEDEYEDMMNDFECEAEDREDEIYSNF